MDPTGCDNSQNAEEDQGQPGHDQNPAGDTFCLLHPAWVILYQY